MRCYNCGSRLSEHDFCTGCGADVSLYKKIMAISNMYYNDGLERAGVRDLTGAITSLRQSLKFNKNNIEARNLLGLVYFETGEVVAALSEWVISKNMRPNKNIADDYIDMVQNNASRLDTIDQTIKKYNQALTYCRQESQDLAVIQLKKVLSLNPKFIRAHQLLALLYMNSEQWDKAKKELSKCIVLDKNNTTTLRYMKEVDAMLMPDESVKSAIKRNREETVRYQSDNEIIIQPLNVKEPKHGGTSTLFNLGIGLVIGAAFIYFLILPARLQSEKAASNKELQTRNEMLDAKTADMLELEQQIGTLTEENKGLHEQIDAYAGTDGTLKSMDSLLDAATAYVTDANDLEKITANLDVIAAEVDMEQTSQSFRTLYQTLLTEVGPKYSADCYRAGYNAYRAGKYEEAIPNLQKAFVYDAANGEALFQLGNAYRKNDNIQEAIAVYDKVIELFPGTEKANKSQQYKNDIVNAQ